MGAFVSCRTAGRSRLAPLLGAAAVGLAAFASVVPAAAQASGDKPGRYTMSPADGGGFARLDTETGQMSLCQRRDGDWSCREMSDPSKGLNAEIERLQAENRKLKSEIRQMEEIMLGDKNKPTPGGPGFKLPSEKDIDEAMDTAQRLLKKFKERLRDLESELPGKGTPL